MMDMTQKENKRILILAAHFDDDIIGFGGLIAREVDLGHEVYVHVFTAGGPASNVSANVRIEEFRNVMKFMGLPKGNYDYSGYHMDGRLDTVPNCELTRCIDDLIAKYKPHEVYCSADSEHMDHHALATAFRGAARLKSGWQPRLWCFGTYMFSHQLPNMHDGGLMISPMKPEYFEKKCEAFKLYKSQFKPSPSPLGLDGLRIMAEYYGMLCGQQYAEMYYQLKYIREL